MIVNFRLEFQHGFSEIFEVFINTFAFFLLHNSEAASRLHNNNVAFKGVLKEN